jgi:hypothetical protein
VVLIWAMPASTVSFEEVVIPVGQEPESVAVVGLNHNGKLDIVVANTASESISVLNTFAKSGSPTVGGKGFEPEHNPQIDKCEATSSDI